MKKIWLVVIILLLSCFVGCTETTTTTEEQSVSVTLWNRDLKTYDKVYLCGGTANDTYKPLNDLDMDLDSEGWGSIDVTMEVLGSHEVVDSIMVLRPDGDLCYYSLKGTEVKTVLPGIQMGKTWGRGTISVMRKPELNFSEVFYQETMILRFTFYSGTVWNKETEIDVINKTVNITYCDFNNLRNFVNLLDNETIDFFYTTSLYENHDGWYCIESTVVNHESPWLSYPAYCWYCPKDNTVHIERQGS